MYYTVKEFSKRTILNLVFSIIQEAHLYASNKLENITGSARLTSIYFGGGTPTEVGTKALGDILKTLRNLFSEGQSEITVEMFPQERLIDDLEEYARLGVTRISIGVQSLDARVLDTSKRPRSSIEMLQRIIDTANKLGLITNLDLMYGMPGQGKAEILETLGTVLNLRPDHITNYRCVLGPYTAAFRLRQTEPNSVLSRIELIEMEREVTRLLEERGYEEYAAGHFGIDTESRSIHETGEWRGECLLGLGPGAMSFIDGTLYKNHPNIASYRKHIESGAAIDVVRLDSQDIVRRMALLSLVKGLQLNMTELEKWSDGNLSSIWTEVALLEKKGLVNFVSPGIAVPVKDELPQLVFEFAQFFSPEMSRKILFGTLK